MCVSRPSIWGVTKSLIIPKSVLKFNNSNSSVVTRHRDPGRGEKQSYAVIKRNWDSAFQRFNPAHGQCSDKGLNYYLFGSSNLGNEELR